MLNNLNCVSNKPNCVSNQYIQHTIMLILFIVGLCVAGNLDAQSLPKYCGEYDCSVVDNMQHQVYTQYIETLGSNG